MGPDPGEPIRKKGKIWLYSGVGVGSAAQGQDIAPWQVCEATDMPLAVDLGGLAAPNVVLDADTSDALLHDVGSDPNCEIYDLPAGI